MRLYHASYDLQSLYYQEIAQQEERQEAMGLWTWLKIGLSLLIGIAVIALFVVGTLAILVFAIPFVLAALAYGYWQYRKFKLILARDAGAAQGEAFDAEDESIYGFQAAQGQKSAKGKRNSVIDGEYEEL